MGGAASCQVQDCWSPKDLCLRHCCSCEHRTDSLLHPLPRGCWQACPRGAASCQVQDCWSPKDLCLSHVGSYHGPQGRLHGGQESWQDSARRSHRAVREWSWQAQEVDRPSARYWHPINAFRTSSVVWLCTLRRHSLKCVLYVYS